MNTTQALKYIDCNENEINTFLAVMNKTDGITVVQLSRELNLPRPTIYGHLDSLSKKGLIRKTLVESGSRFYAEDLKTIMQIFDERSQSIIQAKKTLKQNLKKQNVSGYQPKFVIFDNPNSAESVFKDIILTGEDTYWFWPAEEMIKTVSSESFVNFIEERLKRDIWINVLWPEKKMVDLNKNKFMGHPDPKKSLRKIRILPKNIDFTMGYGIYGNKVAFISSQRENHGYVIDSKELSETMKNHFDYFWGISKKHVK